MFSQDRLYVAKPGPGADREDEICWFVVDDPRQALSREDAVDAFRRVSQLQRGAPADRGDRAAEISRCGQGFGCLLRIGRNDELGCNDAVDRDGADSRLPTPDSRLATRHGCRASGPSPACAARAPLRTYSP